MKTFELKTGRQTPFVISVVCLTFVMIPLSIYLYILFSRLGYPDAFFMIPLVGVIIGIAAFMKRLFTEKYTLQITSRELALLQNEKVLKSVNLENITMVRLRPTVTSEELIIFSPTLKKVFIKLDTVDEKEKLPLIIKELERYLEFDYVSRIEWWEKHRDYINKQVDAAPAPTLPNSILADATQIAPPPPQAKNINGERE